MLKCKEDIKTDSICNSLLGYILQIRGDIGITVKTIDDIYKGCFV